MTDPSADTPDTGVDSAADVVNRLLAGVPAQFPGMPLRRRRELAETFHAARARSRRKYRGGGQQPDGDAADSDAADSDAADSDAADSDAADEPAEEPADDPDPRAYISAQRAAIRAAALRAVIPDGRAQVALAGLSCLDPRDQHPQVLRRWLDDPDQLTLVMGGPTGNGKTMAAYALAAEAAAHTGAWMRTRAGHAEQRRLVVRAWTVNGYLEELRPDGSPDPPWLVRNRARWAELLILDDLGAEIDGYAREFVRKELVELVEYRIEARRRTVFTTNLRASDIEQTFDGRFWSRLNFQSTAVLFKGRDRRVLRALDW